MRSNSTPYTSPTLCPNLTHAESKRQTERERVRDRSVARVGDGTVGVGEEKRKTAGVRWLLWRLEWRERHLRHAHTHTHTA